MANEIHPSVVIIGDVELGDDNFIGPLSVLHGPVRIGNGNYIGSHVVIGTPAEDARKTPRELREAEEYGVEIGNETIIRDLTVIHRGNLVEDTKIGSRCYIHSQSHIDHDCILEDKVILAPCAVLAGVVRIGKSAQVGMAATVHQQRKIGAYAMIGMNATVVDDIPPGALAYGSPARIRGANRRGLARMGIDSRLIDELDIFFRGGGTIPEGLPEALHEALATFQDSAAMRPRDK